MSKWIDVETNKSLLRLRWIKVMRDKKQSSLFEHSKEAQEWVKDNIN